jgi:hypothetical protein
MVIYNESTLQNKFLPNGYTDTGGTGIYWTLMDNGFKYAVTFNPADSGQISTLVQCDAPTPITFSATPSCVGYAPTGVTITIANASGGSGTGYYVVMTSPYGEGYDNTQHSLPYAYSGLNNYVGNTYAFTVYDSEDTPSNNVALTQDFSCAAAPNNTATAGFYQGSNAPNSTACSSSTTYQFELGSPSATFCTSNTFITTNNTLRDLGTGNNYWLCYDGKTRRMFHTAGSYTFQQAGSCSDIIVGF